MYKHVLAADAVTHAVRTEIAHFQLQLCTYVVMHLNVQQLVDAWIGGKKPKEKWMEQAGGGGLLLVIGQTHR